jgi:hypothetical protein
VEQLEGRWCPTQGFSLVTSRTALAGTDSVDWSTLFPTTSPVNPFTILSTAGRSISVSKAIAGNFATNVECPASPGCGWGGNFAPGDTILLTNASGSFLTKSDNPITLNFGTTAVAAGGAQIQTEVQDPFTAKVEAFDANGVRLASFTEHGNSTGAEDNSAIFIGISSTSANISRIALSISAGDFKGDFAINKFDFRTSPVAAGPFAAAPIIGQTDWAPDLTQSTMPAVPAPGSPSVSPASQSGVLPASGSSSSSHAAVTDALFAASQPPTDDDGAWLSPLSSDSLDPM